MNRIDHVWVAQKDGEERRYSSTVPFSVEFARVLLGDGYAIIRIDYEVPDLALAVAASAVHLGG